VLRDPNACPGQVVARSDVVCAGSTFSIYFVDLPGKPHLAIYHALTAARKNRGSIFSEPRDPNVSPSQVAARLGEVYIGSTYLASGALFTLIDQRVPLKIRGVNSSTPRSPFYSLSKFPPSPAPCRWRRPGFLSFTALLSQPPEGLSARVVGAIAVQKDKKEFIQLAGRRRTSFPTLAVL